MNANDIAAARIRDIARNHPVIAQYFNRQEAEKRMNGAGWKNWGMGNLQPIDTSNFPQMRTVSTQPTLLSTVRDFGFAVANAYANKELAEVEMKALREQARLELQRAQQQAETARIQAEAQRSALVADQYQRALMESQQAELNLDRFFSDNKTSILIGVVGLGLAAWALSA